MFRKKKIRTLISDTLYEIEEQGANAVRPPANARTNFNNKRDRIKQRVIKGCQNNRRTFNEQKFNQLYGMFGSTMNDELLFQTIRDTMSASGGGQKEYVKLQSGGKRVVRYGPKGGRYYMKGGNKVYIK